MQPVTVIVAASGVALGPRRGFAVGALAALASNLFLYHLERHSDHHANPTRRYQALRHVDEAPQLPSGYALMICVAFVPPLWRRVMDPKVLAHYDGDVTRANILPRKRKRLLAKYGGGA